MCTPRLSVVDRTDVPADLNGLVRFAGRLNLVSARVPQHFKRSLTEIVDHHTELGKIAGKKAPVFDNKNTTEFELQT
jgi:hypothetical protein